jgi:60 kDa SS-A/Ro ribonucleoprotein
MEHDRVDQLVISDEPQRAGAPFRDVLDEYRREVNPAVKTFIIDVAGTRSALAPFVPGTFHVYGWCDEAIAWMAMMASGLGEIGEAVRAGIN